MKETNDSKGQHTLKEVIAIIPDSCYENPVRKAMPYVVGDFFLYSLAIFGLLATDNPLLLVPLWIFAAMSISALFILAHDASHGALFQSRKLCRTLGRILMLPSLHSYSAWDMGHNRIHHSFTIKQDRDFVWHPLTQEEYRALSPLQKLAHRFEWSIGGAGIYYLVEVWWKKMIVLQPPEKLAGPIKEDNRFVFYFFLFTVLLALTLGHITGASIVYSLWAWFKMLIVPWLIFNHIIGATVYIHHIHPEISWHSHSLWSKFKGQVEGTTNIRLPAVLNIFFHNIFIHIPHHVDPRIPFYNLPAAAAAIKQNYQSLVHDQPLKLRDYLRATKRCKLYDFENEAWFNYRGEPAASNIGPLR